MKPLTREWANKAEADYRSMLWEMQAPAPANFDSVCFHAQQCCEKYAKALLQEAGVPFRRTHDLGEILDLAASVDLRCTPLKVDAQPLNSYAVEFRYPGMSATEDDAEDAIARVERIRRVLRNILGIV